MALELIDTHCHLSHEPLSASVDAVIARAREAGVIGCLTIGTDVQTSRANVELARRYPKKICWRKCSVEALGALTSRNALATRNARALFGFAET